MKTAALRRFFISVFSLFFVLIFHYESVRYFYLNPLFGRDLPKMKFLFPPAGWVMFYNVNHEYTGAEVYGVQSGKPEFIDPHKILETKGVGYDNIHRNVLIEVVYAGRKEAFCGFLKRKFPAYDGFLVTAARYPSLAREPASKLHAIMYTCD